MFIVRSLTLSLLLAMSAISAFAAEGQITTSFNLLTFSCQYQIKEKEVTVAHLVKVRAPSGNVAVASVQAALAVQNEARYDFANNVEVVCTELPK